MKRFFIFLSVFFIFCFSGCNFLNSNNTATGWVYWNYSGETITIKTNNEKHTVKNEDYLYILDSSTEPVIEAPYHVTIKKTADTFQGSDVTKIYISKSISIPCKFYNSTKNTITAKIGAETYEIKAAETLELSFWDNIPSVSFYFDNYLLTYNKNNTEGECYFYIY